MGWIPAVLIPSVAGSSQASVVTKATRSQAIDRWSPAFSTAGFATGAPMIRLLAAVSLLLVSGCTLSVISGYRDGGTSASSGGTGASTASGGTKGQLSGTGSGTASGGSLQGSSGQGNGSLGIGDLRG